MYSARMSACGLAVVAALVLVLPRPASCGSNGASKAAKIVLEPVAKQHEQGPMTFRYRIGRPTMVSLTVRDANGWVVKTLVDDSVGAGDHAAVWDGTNLDGRAAHGKAFLVELRADGSMQRQIFVLKRPFDAKKSAAL